MFRDDEGITTVSMAVAIFVSIALLFTGAQVYQVESASAEIQEVADACALAAENEVAEFVTAANACDAALLSMTLLAGTLYGVGLVAACVPPAAAISEKLIELAGRVMDGRERAYEGMTRKLNAIQDWLPFLASANALGMARANGEGALDASYLAIAELVPAKGESLVTEPAEGLMQAGQRVEESAEGIRDKAAEADEAAKRAAEAKQRAFEADCGNDPAYCMSERARSLAGLGEEENPVYASVDAWGFEVGLRRIKAYYAKRLGSWSLSGTSVEQRADAMLRKRFYQYACQELASAWIHDEEGSFAASLPALYRNTEEMRATSLYAEAAYPVTQSGGALRMHAWSGCPEAADAIRLGAIAEMDSGGFVICPRCRFSVSSLGKVAAASTSIANGFEHHYQAFRQAVEEYEAQRAIADPLGQAVRDEVLPLLESIGASLSDALAKRIHAQPPGRDGCVAMVVNLSESSPSSGFESTFVAEGRTLGARAAVSGAVVMGDDTEEGSDSIQTILSKLVPQGGALGIAGGLWTTLLSAYEKGHEALLEAVGQGIGSFSTSTSSGLGSWAREALGDVIDTVGLEPGDIRSKKPVIVNTANAVRYDDGSFAVGFRQAKAQGLASSTSSGLLSGVASKASDAIGEAVSSSRLDVCEIDLPFANGPMRIEWALPAPVSEAAGGAVEHALAGICGAIESCLGTRVWQ